METNNMAAMREALLAARYCLDNFRTVSAYTVDDTLDKVDAALAATPHTGKWLNGRKYEYEYAYCSHCGHMQYADWDTHSEAAEKIGTFHEKYKFCPNCGAQMKGDTDGK